MGSLLSSSLSSSKLVSSQPLFTRKRKRLALSGALLAAFVAAAVPTASASAGCSALNYSGSTTGSNTSSSNSSSGVFSAGDVLHWTTSWTSGNSGFQQLNQVDSSNNITTLGNHAFYPGGEQDVTITSAGTYYFYGYDGTAIASPESSVIHLTLTCSAGTSAPTVSAVSQTVSYDSSSNNITLSITGTATSVAVSGAASHGTATASGTSISYTPTTGFRGTDTFSYTASNSGGTLPLRH
jgi:hypothetical protein